MHLAQFGEKLMTRKVYVMVKETYGDFDALHEEVLCVSENKSTLDAKCNELKAKRSEEEILNGIDYSVLYNAVKVI